LAKNYNSTTYNYTGGDGPIQRSYLLDINPWYLERELGDGMNVIDGRWIDTSTGLFVDITGLSHRETNLHTNTHIWMCKHDHRYLLGDLFPLCESTFEGVKAKMIPYAYVAILEEEYSDLALKRTEFHG